RKLASSEAGAKLNECPRYWWASQCSSVWVRANAVCRSDEGGESVSPNGCGEHRHARLGGAKNWTMPTVGPGPCYPAHRPSGGSKRTCKQKPLRTCSYCISADGLALRSVSRR